MGELGTYFRAIIARFTFTNIKKDLKECYLTFLDWYNPLPPNTYIYHHR